MNVGMQHIAIKAPFEMQLVVPVLDFVWFFFLRTTGSELLVSAVVVAPHQVAAQGELGDPKHPEHEAPPTLQVGERPRAASPSAKGHPPRRKARARGLAELQSLLERWQ